MLLEGIQARVLSGKVEFMARDVDFDVLGENLVQVTELEEGFGLVVEV